MTLVVLFATPPEPGAVLPRLPQTAPVDAEDATALYRAMLRDVASTAARSGGELLVNYLSADDTPGFDGDAEAAVRDALDGLDALDDPRFEVQVGSSRGARVGNTVTHLLEEEDHGSVAMLDPTAPLLERSRLDEAAMKLRRRDAVLCHGGRGRVAFAGFGAPPDFTDAFRAPELQTLTDRCVDAGLDVGFLSDTTAVETGDDLLSVASAVRARQTAGRRYPPETAAWIQERGLRVTAGADGPELSAGTDSS